MASLIPSIPLNPIDDPKLKAADLLLIPKPLTVRKSEKGPGSPYSCATAHTSKLYDKEDSSWPPYLLLRDVQWITDEVDKTVFEFVDLNGSRTRIGDMPTKSPYLVQFRPRSLAGNAKENGLQINDVQRTRSTRFRNTENNSRRHPHEPEVLKWLGKKSVDHAEDRDPTNQSFTNAQPAQSTKQKREDKTQEKSERLSSKPRDKNGGNEQASRVEPETGLKITDASNAIDLSRTGSSRTKRKSSLRKEALKRDSGLISAKDEKSSKDSALSTEKRARAISFRHRKNEEEPAQLRRTSSSQSAGRSAAPAEKSYSNWFFR